MEEKEEILLTAQAEDRDQRLDRYVSDKVEDLSRSMARRLIDEAQVLVNGQPAKPSASIQPGDVVAVRRPAPAPVAIEAEDIPLQIVYEDDDLVVIDKPAGMVVHPAPGHSHGTVVNAVLARYPGISVGGELRPGIVHRLDRDTSGLLVIARNDAALHGIQAQQLARTMDKRYLLVADGPFKQQSGVIDAPIGRHPSDRLRMAILASGREARTHWRVLEELAEYTLVEAKLETGRTHQIRVHFTHMHRPVLGDPLYGPKRPRALFGLQRQFLHAYQLAFDHPRTGQPVRCESPLPPDLAAALEKLRARAR